MPACVDRYKGVLISFMTWKDGEPYPRNTEFPREALTAITPEDIYRYFKYKTYGDANANEDTENPILARCNSLKTWKKSLSYFMPNNMLQWNELASVGNPTKSAIVNKLLRQVKKKEAARLGVASEARRAFFASEYESAMDLMDGIEDEESRTFSSAYFKFQYSMIARLDDTAKFRLPDLKPFHAFPKYGIVAKLCWSKNVLDERDAPDQVLLGSFDQRYCALIGLGMWLEFHFSTNPEENEYVFGIGGLTHFEGIKNRAGSLLRKILNDDRFTAVDDGKTGTHSLRKFATTKARGGGCSKDDTDTRARWKGQSRQQDQYAAVTIPYVDAKVAAALCKGGPCAYAIVVGSGITDDWILEHVVPHIRARIANRNISLVLGKAVLWKIFDDESFVPREMLSKVRDAYHDVEHRGGFAPGTNPIRKVHLAIEGVDSQLMMDTLFENDNNDNDNGDGEGNGDAGGVEEEVHNYNTRVGRRFERQEIQFLRNQVMHLRQENCDLKLSLEMRDIRLHRQLRFINNNVRRIANAPGRREAENRINPVIAEGVNENNEVGDNEVGDNEVVAELSRVPRTLHALWDEYEVGSTGKKAAKEFTKAERGGNNKHKFYMRKFLWDQVSQMVCAGMDSKDACDKIYNVYGERESVTNILKALQRDKRVGGHPRLRIRRL